MDSLFNFASLTVEPFTFVVNPQKRIYWGYLLSGMLFAVLVLWLSKQNLRSAFVKALGPKVWLHPSSMQDFHWLIFNHVLRVLIIVPVIGGSLSFAIHLNRFAIKTWGEGNFWQVAEWQMLAMFTCALFVLEDFTRFLVHYFYHKSPLLWRFHAVHHAATVLTPITLYRIHWLEMIINSLRSLIVVGTLSAVFIYCFENRISIYDVLGLNIFNFLANTIGANLRHTSLWVGFGYFERWFVSPAQHQIHHSSAEKHIDKNFGAILSIWDRLFNSWVPSREQKVVQYGLAGQDVNVPENFLASFWGESSIPIVKRK